MADTRCRGYAGRIPVYCSHDKIVPVGEIEPNPKNPNQHPESQIELLAKIITTQGWRAPVTVSTRSGLVVRGHGRLMAAKFAGLDFVPVDFQHYESNDAELADLLADNRLAELAEIDNRLLADLFADIDTSVIDIDLTGYTEEEYKNIIDALAMASNETELKDPEAEVALPRVAVTKPGDIWKVGRHRLVCGDSTDKATVELLMNGAKADIAFSSPPYNAGTTATEVAMGKTTKYNGKDDDKSEAEYIEFLNAYLKRAIEHSEYVFMNVQSISNNKIALIDVLHSNKDIYADTIIWDKIHSQPAMSKNVMNSVFEYVHVFSKKANRAIGTIPFRGTLDNILHLSPVRKNDYSDIHNATFSVEFASYFVKNFAKSSVLDQFGGTGTTLIACEQLGRTCYTMDIEPIYCDVIVLRYMQVTGKHDIVLLRDGNEIPVEDTGILDD